MWPTLKLGCRCQTKSNSRINKILSKVLVESKSRNLFWYEYPTSNRTYYEMKVNRFIKHDRNKFAL